MKDFELRAAFSKVLEYLHIIDAKVSVMPQVQVQVSVWHLRTFNALVKLGKSATATEVAAVTGCARAHESKILNELFGRGIVMKEKQGRKRVFRVRVGDEG
jgi:predicted transcriptional regulator